MLRLTLLRGAEYPDPQADRGEHDFTYSLFPHQGDWRQGETVRAAASLNQPLVGTIGAAPAGGSRSYFSLDGPAILDAVKPAEDGRGWILRFYEANGGRGMVTLRSHWAVQQVTACNHIEEDGEVVSCSADGFSFTVMPFQIRTFRLEF